MFKIGDRVLYASYGVCDVIGLESMRFGKTRANYYCLQPLEQPASRYYVPADNETAVAKLSPLMTREAMLELLRSERIRLNNWISDESQRKLRYRELLGSGDREAILNMIYCVHQHKDAQQKAGKKFHQCDDSFLHDAQRILNSEFTVVFGLEPEQISAFVLEQMNMPG